MRNELNLLFVALTYYSRLPVPKGTQYSPERLARSFRYFPLVGMIVGVIGAGVWWVADFGCNGRIAAIGALAAMLLASGAIHEDGFSDCFDGFGGGYTQEKILSIMKDSHIGVFGVVALTMLLLFKYVALTSIVSVPLPIVLIVAQGCSRVVPLFLVRTSRYVRDEKSKAGHTKLGIDGVSLTIGTLVGTIPLALFDPLIGAMYVLLNVVLLLLYRRFLHRRIGGFTGDTLGALQQGSELLFYLTLICYESFGV